MANWITRESDQADWKRIASNVHIFREARVAAQWREAESGFVFRLHFTRSEDGAEVTIDGTLLAGLLGPVLATVQERIIWTPTLETDAPAQWQHLYTTSEAMLAQARRLAVVG